MTYKQETLGLGLKECRSRQNDYFRIKLSIIHNKVHNNQVVVGDVLVSVGSESVTDKAVIYIPYLIENTKEESSDGLARLYFQLPYIDSNINDSNSKSSSSPPLPPPTTTTIMSK